MGDSPTPPPVPNPYQVSQAQTGTNINSALASSVLSNANVVSPYGSTTYSTQPSSTTIEGINIPQYTQTTVLSPAQQQMLDLRNQTGIGLNQLALDETGTIRNLLSSQHLGQGLMGFGSVPNAPTYQGLPNAPQMQVAQLQQMGNPNPLQQNVDMQSQVMALHDSGPISNNYSIQGAQGLGQNFDPTAGVQTGLAGTHQGVSYGFDPRGNIQSQLGRIPGQMAFNFSQGGPIQGQIGQVPGQMAFDLGEQGAIQSAIANEGQIAHGFGPSGNITTTVGPNDYSQDRTNVENAILSRVNPQLERDRTSLETSLVNQGYARGTQAFNEAMDQSTRQANDARMQAVLAGGQEQSRLANLAVQQGQFENAAQQQGFTQQQARSLFQNLAEQQAYQESLGRGTFANTAQAQGYGQAANTAQFQNAAQQQAFNQAMGAGQFANSAQAQTYGQNANTAQFQNAAQQQAFNQAMGAGQFANAAQQQGFAQDTSQLQQHNAAQLQEYQQALGAGQFANAAAGQNFAQTLGAGQFNNQAAAQNTQNALNAAQFYNQAQNQTFGQNLQGGQFANQAIAGNNAANIAGGQFYNQAQAQGFAQNQAQLAFNNAIRSGDVQAANQAAQYAYQQAVAQVQQGNANSQQTYANQLSSTQLQNQINAQQLQQQFALQSFPINQATALLSGGQINNPMVTPYQAGQIQPTNVASNVYNSSALANQQYQQQLAQNNAFNGGLFGLGSSALLGGLSGGSAGFGGSAIGLGLAALSDRRLKRNVVDLGIRLMNGIKLYAFSYLWDSIHHIGAMADEVLKIKPAAVSRIGGYDMVDYALVMEKN